MAARPQRRAAPQRRVGFHGLDVYSLSESLRAVLDYLTEHEPDHLPAAREALRCFEPYRQDPQSYALASRLVPQSCEAEVVTLLGELRRPDGVEPSGGGARDERFIAEQNAEAAAGAERYYRAMVRGGPQSTGPGARAAVWEHNTHVGDARAKDMTATGMHAPEW